VLAILAAVTMASTPAPKVFVERPVLAGPETVCKATGRYEIADRALLYREDGRDKLSQLGDLPKANHEKAVVRTIGECSAPVIVRYGVGR
jgi:hypothetical protein